MARTNIYAEELSDRVEIISKEIEGHEYTAVRFYLELPVTVLTCPRKSGEVARRLFSTILPDGDCIGCGLRRDQHIPHNVSGPFMHRHGDDDSAAVTFWGKRDLRTLLKKALDLLDQHYAGKESA